MYGLTLQHAIVIYLLYSYIYLKIVYVSYVFFILVCICGAIQDSGEVKQILSAAIINSFIF